MVPHLNLFRLQVFAAIVEHGGLSRAAHDLNLTQPTVSFHLRELERIFRVKLIVFKGRSFALTESGKVVFQLGRRILRDAETMAERVDDIAQGSAGSLRVGLSLSLECPRTYSEIFRPFLAANPRAHVSLRFGLSIPLCDELVERQLDLAYLVGLTRSQELVFEPLHEEDLLMLVSPDHPLAQRNEVTQQELANTRLIVPSRGLAGRGEYETVLRLSGFPPGTSPVEVDSGEGWIQAARAGIGVAPVYRPAAEDEIRRGTLVPLRVVGPTVRGVFGLAYRPDAHWTPLMTAFADRVRAYCKTTLPQRTPAI